MKAEPLDALFARALELAPAERERWLVALAAERPGDARELASLLDAHERAGSFLRDEPELAVDALERACPERIGSYRVLGLLGEGGMGVVYLAEQAKPRRTVALKVLRPSLASPRQLARFEREAALLGRLSHRGIARVFEAGVADAGAGPQPFLAMEHVRGAALDHWVAERRPPLRARLELVADVCDAVEAAHAEGIVHRDLKPANVLVDDEGAIHVLDFGVARALGGELGPTEARTVAGQLVGTLPYMSPEQASGDPEAVDRRSDVYSLGVMLYRLVAERLPYELEGLTLIDAVRVVREREPASLAALRPTVPADVQTILRKALEKEPRRRYASAGELGRDLRRYLDARPVLARPPTATYQLARLAQRHKALFGGAAATLLALSVGLAVALRQNALLRAERDRVAAEKRNADAVAGWFEALLASASPWQGGRDVPLRVVLERAEADLPPEVLASPAIEARVRRAIGATFETLGDLERAEIELAQARRRAIEAHGAESAEALEIEGRLGRVVLLRGRSDEAERSLIHARDGLAREAGPGSELALAAADNLALCLQEQGRFEEAEALLRADAAAYRALGVGARASALTADTSLANLLTTLGRNEEAIELLRPALAEGRELDGPRHPRTLMRENDLANALVSSGRQEEALPILEELDAAAREVMGADNPDALSCRLNYAMCLCALDRTGEALPILREVLAKRLALFGEVHVATLTARNDLAVACAQSGSLDEAEREYGATLAGLERLSGAGAKLGQTRLNLARLRLQRGEAEAARDDFERAVRELERALGPDDWRVAGARAGLGEALAATGLPDEAAAELERAVRALRAKLGEDDERTRGAMRALSALRSSARER